MLSPIISYHLATGVTKAEMIMQLDFDDNENYLEHFNELTQMQYKIELLVNPNEEDHMEIVRLIGDIRDAVHDEVVDDEFEDEVDKLFEDLMKVTRGVLKREWNVVKKGK